jgi:hypothetical protein
MGETALGVVEAATTRLVRVGRRARAFLGMVSVSGAVLVFLAPTDTSQRTNHAEPWRIPLRTPRPVRLAARVAHCAQRDGLSEQRR